MRLVIQRTKGVKLFIDNELHSETKSGLLILFGTQNGDNEQLLDKLVDKTANLRIFEDEDGKMNRSISDLGGEVMVVSQFTLYANCDKGRRPSFNNSLNPEDAEILYNSYIEKLKETGLKVETGIFGARMDIHFDNDGPVTIILDNDIQ